MLTNSPESIRGGICAWVIGFFDSCPAWLVVPLVIGLFKIALGILVIASVVYLVFSHLNPRGRHPQAAVDPETIRQQRLWAKQRDITRWPWFGPLVGLAILTIAVVVVAIARNNALEDAFTGGNNFFYFRAEARNQGEKLHSLLIVNFKNKQLFDPFVEIFPLVDGVKQQRIKTVKDTVVRAVTVRPGIYLPIGIYKFEITARNGYWEEYLDLVRSGTTTHQTIRVMRDGALVYEDQRVLPDKK